MRGVVIMAIANAQTHNVTLVSRSTMKKILTSSFEKIDEKKAAKEAKDNLKKQGFRFW